ncbi:MAG: hypothetical protein JXQ68_04260 [Campylobacterales bacterium]|nr:hypothetical protein [Campylobacterales bacterium]
MSSLSETIIVQISTLEKRLKNENILLEILKKRLTKKELKLLKLQSQRMDETIMCEQLKLTQDRLDEMKTTLRKKLNSEKLKQELML